MIRGTISFVSNQLVKFKFNLISTKLKMARSNHRRVFNFSPQSYNMLLALSPLNQSTTKANLTAIFGWVKLRFQCYCLNTSLLFQSQMHCRPSPFVAFRVRLTPRRVKSNVNFKEDLQFIIPSLLALPWQRSWTRQLECFMRRMRMFMRGGLKQCVSVCAINSGWQK